MNNSFELGPIRPPSEAKSILLRVTRNCPWNKCTFCHTYKDEKFSRRTKEEILGDIDSIYTIAQRIIETADSPEYAGKITEEVIRDAVGTDITPEYYYRQVAYWLHFGMKSLFVQDANSLLLKVSELAEILRYIKEKFPTIERITTYARSKTVSKKSLEELKQLRAAGLTRIHIGMESGSDTVLEFIKKGVTAEEHIIAGRRVVEAGFDLSEYYMPGLGGKELLEENARESARVINSINPAFVRLRSTVPIPGTPLFQAMIDNNWLPTTEKERVKEIRIFLGNLEGIDSMLLSDHMMNLLEEVEGKLPDDKEKMINVIDAFLNFGEDDMDNFIIGRRIGHLRYISDYNRNPELEKLRIDLKQKFGTIDKAVMEVLKNYI